MHQSANAVPVGATRLDQLTVSYPDGTVGISAISVRLAPGEQVAIIGPSGAGKSTLLASIGATLRPSSGALELFGCDPWSLSTRERQKIRGRLFLAPQSPPLPPRQRVVHAVLAGRLPQWSTSQALRSLAYPADRAAAYNALERFRIADKLFLRCDRLSGGERQRVGLARLLVSNAQLLLLDEPVSALDPALATATLDVLVAEARARGATLVVSLHAVDLALSRFTRILGLRAGRVVFDLPRGEVTDALLTDLYGAELGASFQAAPEAVGAHAQLTRCL